MNTVNIEQLKAVSASNPKYKAMFEVYGKRLRGRQDSTVARARRVLKDHGIEISTVELADFYQQMQAAGAGRWIAGRNGMTGRFVWGFHLKSIADNVNGCKFELDKKNLQYTLDPKTKTRVIDRDRSGYITLPLEYEDKIKNTPKPKVKLPHVEMIGTPEHEAVEETTAPVSPVSTTPVEPRTMTVKKDGFEIQLPIDNMSASDWKDISVFFRNLEAV